MAPPFQIGCNLRQILTGLKEAEGYFSPFLKTKFYMLVEKSLKSFCSVSVAFQCGMHVCHKCSVENASSQLSCISLVSCNNCNLLDVFLNGKVNEELASYFFSSLDAFLTCDEKKDSNEEVCVNEVVDNIALVEQPSMSPLRSNEVVRLNALQKFDPEKCMKDLAKKEVEEQCRISILQHAEILANDPIAEVVGKKLDSEDDEMEDIRFREAEERYLNNSQTRFDRKVLNIMNKEYAAQTSDEEQSDGFQDENLEMESNSTTSSYQENNSDEMRDDQCNEIEVLADKRKESEDSFEESSDSESEKDEEFEMLSDKGTKKVEEDNDITSSDEVGDSSPMKVVSEYFSGLSATEAASENVMNRSDTEEEEEEEEAAKDENVELAKSSSSKTTKIAEESDSEDSELSFKPVIHRKVAVGCIRDSSSTTSSSSTSSSSRSEKQLDLDAFKFPEERARNSEKKRKSRSSSSLIGRKKRLHRLWYSTSSDENSDHGKNNGEQSSDGKLGGLTLESSPAPPVRLQKRKVDDNDEESEEMKEKTKKRHLSPLSNSENEKEAVTVDSSKEETNEEQVTQKGETEEEEEEKKSKEDEKKKKKKDEKKNKEKDDGESENSDLNELQSPRKKNTLRRDIRGIMKMKDLKKSTVKAHRDEMARRKRIEMLQKKYNNFSNAPTVETVNTGKVVLEISEDGKPIVEVDEEISKMLKPHQAKGVQFLYQCIFEKKSKEKNLGGGCILAHCMGLGKTFQVLAFLHTVMKDVDFNVNRVLIVTPINVVLNWRNEISLWLDDHGFDKNIWAMHEVRTTKDRYYVIERWENDGGILIIGYELLRYLLTCTRKGNRAMIEKAFSKPGPDIVVCDEAHRLKNEKSGISQALLQIPTKRRICLTGTPLQNNLMEYYAMVNFVKPNLLGTRMEFLNRFVNPIKNGQMSDSTLGDVALMKRRVHILHNLLCGFVHRVDYRAISEALPPKFEYVLFVRLSNVQRKLYTDYLGTFYDESRNVKDKSVLQSALFVHYQVLQRVCSHPRELFIMEERAQKKVQLKRLPVSNGANGNKVMENKLNEYESEQSLSSSLSTNSCELTDEEPANREQSVAKDLPKPIEPPPVSKKNWYLPTLKEDDPLLVEMSGKMVVLFEIIQRCGDIGDKVLIFSQSLITLDLIEELLRLQERNVGESSSREFNYWVPGIDYIRMDGSTNASTRERLAKKFNDETNRRCRVFLLSTKAGSLGINLIGANRVVVFDANWNPSHDLQAMFRVYRLGQCKPVYIYRLIAKGTMEETIYQRQVVKQSLSCRVIDEQQIGRHFTFSDLEYLYHFDPDEDDKHRTETPVLPKDRLLADLLCDISQWIIRYIEHDSLLKNIVEEKLTEEELKSAWREYEDERKREKDAKEQLELQQQMNYNVPPPLVYMSPAFAPPLTPPPPPVPQSPPPPPLLLPNFSVGTGVQQRMPQTDVPRLSIFSQGTTVSNPTMQFSHSTPTLLARLTGNYELAQHVRLPRPHSMTSSSTSPDLMMGTDRLFPEMREKMPDLTFTSRAKFGNPPVNSSEINTLVTPEIRSKLLRIANRTGKSMQNWLKQISLEYPQATTNRVALQNVVDDLYRQHGQPRL
ncbi:Transcriptional regulator ATRX -like protein [Trichinella spiralis]|uniref:Transcriptional regulator ATRX-like protein n=1 Tax=Trichinella spiralis TaxID=6334 RepID=A0A0V1AXW3_TRISP|nr:Transcriptional regulator ATRX -like protein [Trichinella spiralis]